MLREEVLTAVDLLIRENAPGHGCVYSLHPSVAAELRAAIEDLFAERDSMDAGRKAYFDALRSIRALVVPDDPSNKVRVPDTLLAIEAIMKECDDLRSRLQAAEGERDAAVIGLRSIEATLGTIDHSEAIDDESKLAEIITRKILQLMRQRIYTKEIDDLRARLVTSEEERDAWRALGAETPNAMRTVLELAMESGKDLRARLVTAEAQIDECKALIDAQFDYGTKGIVAMLDDANRRARAAAAQIDECERLLSPGPIERGETLKGMIEVVIGDNETLTEWRRDLQERATKALSLLSQGVALAELTKPEDTWGYDGPNGCTVRLQGVKEWIAESRAALAQAGEKS